MPLGPGYARGDKAWGICYRCGLRSLLKDLIFDGRYPWVRVHEGCFEAKHPQERMIVAVDPIALYRPSPEVGGPTAPVLSGTDVGGPASSLSWTVATVGDSIIVSYSLYRSVNGGDFAFLTTLPVQRDWDGSILVQPLSYLDSGVLTGQVLMYYVAATDANHRSARSNAVTITLSGGVGTFFRLLEDGSRRLIEASTDRRLLE